MTRHINNHSNDDAKHSDLSPQEQQSEVVLHQSLRPNSFESYIGQDELIDNLKVFVRAAKKRKQALDHVLLAGPPGLGKTTLAHVLAEEAKATLHTTSGPAIDHKGVLASLLTSLNEGDVLFIDEIHRLSAVVEENLYPAMEDFRFDLFVGDGPYAKAVTMNLPRFTLIGATTRVGMLTGPLYNRFGFHAQIHYYNDHDMIAIVKRSAQILKLEIEDEGVQEIARRSRGTPRISNRLLNRVRDFADVDNEGLVSKTIAAKALDRLGIDHVGLDLLDRRYLTILAEQFQGGPVGVETMVAALSEDRGTIEDVVEPFLLQQGFIARTARGRVALDKTLLHLGLK